MPEHSPAPAYCDVFAYEVQNRYKIQQIQSTVYIPPAPLGLEKH